MYLNEYILKCTQVTSNHKFFKYIVLLAVYLIRSNVTQLKLNDIVTLAVGISHRISLSTLEKITAGTSTSRFWRTDNFNTLSTMLGVIAGSGCDVETTGGWGRGLGVVWAWFGRGLGVVWAWFGRGLF